MQTEVVVPPPSSDLDDTLCHLSDDDGKTALCGADLTGDNQCVDHSNHAECVVCFGMAGLR